MGYAGIFLFIQEAIILLVSTKYYKRSSDVSGAGSSPAPGGHLTRFEERLGGGEQLLLADLWDEDVERHPRVIEAGRHKDNAASARNAGECKDPKQNPIKNRRYVLPVINDL